MTLYQVKVHWISFIHFMSTMSFKYTFMISRSSCRVALVVLNGLQTRDQASHKSHKTNLSGQEVINESEKRKKQSSAL